MQTVAFPAAEVRRNKFGFKFLKGDQSAGITVYYLKKKTRVVVMDARVILSEISYHIFLATFNFALIVLFPRTYQSE